MILVQSFVFFKQKTSYDMRISDWSSDLCSSDLDPVARHRRTDAADAADVQRSGLAAFAASPAAAMIVAAKGVAAETAGSDVPAGEAATQPGKPGVDFKMPLAAQPEAPLVETLKTGPAKMTAEAAKIGRAHVCTPVTNA